MTATAGMVLAHARVKIGDPMPGDSNAVVVLACQARGPGGTAMALDVWYLEPAAITTSGPGSPGGPVRAV